MAYFAVNYLYRADADVAAVRPEHRAYLATLVEAGSLLASGPFVGTERDTALLIFKSESADEVAKLVSQDPMQLQNIVEETKITEWNPVLGVFAK